MCSTFTLCHCANAFKAKTGKLWMSVEFQDTWKTSERLCLKRYDEVQYSFDIIESYLISVSSSTITSHLVLGTALLRNLCRIANVFPQWPANEDMLSIEEPEWLNYISTMCGIVVHGDKRPLGRKAHWYLFTCTHAWVPQKDIHRTWQKWKK